MFLDIDDARMLRYVVSEMIRHRQHYGPVPDVLRRMDARLAIELELLSGSDTGTPLTPSLSELKSESIGSAEVARMLGCSQRRVRYIAKDLDGQLVGKAWVFDRAVVAEYAANRKGGVDAKFKGPWP
ncbi:hypothetical protein AB0C34_01610 [Nocardia sp. NPDC049220]|uniref:hypothetical protein n=1 Tax=Nocardia sp. NPDC049220 TaxID=3155273 RepID=UPI0033EB0972